MNPQNKKMVVLGLIGAAAVLALAYFLFAANQTPVPSPIPTVEIPTPTVEIPTPSPENLPSPSGTPLGK